MKHAFNILRRIKLILKQETQNVQFSLWYIYEKRENKGMEDEQVTHKMNKNNELTKNSIVSNYKAMGHVSMTKMYFNYLHYFYQTVYFQDSTLCIEFFDTIQTNIQIYNEKF